MKTPQHASGITKEWISFFLTEYESKFNENIRVTATSFSVQSAIKPGESFNAELVMLDVEATLSLTENQEAEPEAKEYHLIAKFLSQDPFIREMVKQAQYHIRELSMYSEIADKLNAFQNEKLGSNKYPIHVPKFIYGKCTRKEYVLVMENLKSTGYSTFPKETGLDLEHMKLALSQAAHLHAVSYAYSKEHRFLEEHPCFKFNSVISALFKPVVYQSWDNMVKFLRTKEEYKDIVSKLDIARQKLPAKFNSLWDDQSRHRFLTLNHGDFWISNLLYRYADPDRSIESIKVIDWQLSTWNNPMMDVHYLFNTSTTRDLRKEHKKDLLQYYLNLFNEAMHQLASEPPLSGEEFKMEFDRLSIVGFLMGICLTQGTLSRAGELINQQAIATENPTLFNRLKSGLKSTAARVIVPIAFQPSSNWIIKSAIKKKLDPIGKELIAGENELMNTRLLDLIQEAEDTGLLDVMNV